MLAGRREPIGCGVHQQVSIGSETLDTLATPELATGWLLTRSAMPRYRLFEIFVDYVVQQGDCLSSVARCFGFADIQPIYEHPRNRALFKQRQNANLLLPGDVLHIPERVLGLAEVSTARRHAFTAKSPEVTLRLRILDRTRSSVANEAYLLRSELFEVRGTTDSDGMVIERIPAHLDEALLVIAARQIQQRLRIGALDPIAETSGIQGRLRNLGYDCGAIDGIAGPLTRAAIRAFQADHPPLECDGVCGPKTSAALLAVYGC